MGDGAAGEEDLSYVSGDERDFNESVQELRFGAHDTRRQRMKNVSPIQQRIEALKGDS